MTYDIADKKPQDTIDLETAIREKHIIGFVNDAQSEQNPDRYIIHRFNHEDWCILSSKKWSCEMFTDGNTGSLDYVVGRVKDGIDYKIVKSFTTYGEAVKWYLEE